MKPITALMVSGLLALSVASCTTTEYIHVKPECTPPPQPVLPEIDQGELWDALGDERYRQLERYINGVWAYSDEQGAMLDELCKP
ncbi:hypothetical protein ACT3S5_00465 [Halomonas sp. AOP31-B1-25]|uniref:hypothetical protein n=1 Tax=Halomonas sp. AOP31-B1-25 TaxID=3457694 RepID=UPI00403371E6